MSTGAYMQISTEQLSASPRPVNYLLDLHLTLQSFMSVKDTYTYSSSYRHHGHNDILKVSCCVNTSHYVGSITDFRSDRTVANAKFAILSLPTELRVKIFEMVVVVEPRRWHVFMSESRGEVRLQECHARGFKATEDVAEQCHDKGCSEKTENPDNKRPSLTNTPLLLVCRQFYEDAVDAVESEWQNHIFQINLPPLDTLAAFVEKLTQRKRKAIKTLHLQFQTWNQDDYYFVAEENPLYMISELTGLRYLFVNLRGEHRQTNRIDLRGRAGLQLMQLRSLDLDLAKVRILVTTVPPTGIPLFARIRSVDMDYSELWRKSIALPLRYTEDMPEPL